MNNNEQTGDQPKDGQTPQPVGDKKPEKTINKRLQRTQAQVNEVVDIMRVNIEKVLERDKNLSQLDDRADALQAGASQFEASAGKLKRKFWWRNCKLLMVLCGIVAIIAIIIIVAITSEKRDTSNLNESSPMNSTSLSSDLSSFESVGGEELDKGPPQNSLKQETEESPQETQTKLPIIQHSGSRMNRVFPHGEETIPSFPPANSQQKSQYDESEMLRLLTRSELSSEDGDLDDDLLAIR